MSSPIKDAAAEINAHTCRFGYSTVNAIESIITAHLDPAKMAAWLKSRFRGLSDDGIPVAQAHLTSALREYMEGASDAERKG